MKKTYFLSVLLFFSFSIFSQAPNIEWQNRFGGSSSQIAFSSQETTDGEFIIGGRSNSNISGDKTENSWGEYDYWLVKTNSTGIILWDQTIGAESPSGSEQDWFYSLKITSDGGAIICGYSDSPISGNKTEAAINGSADFWIVKTDALGAIEWQNVIGGDLGDVPSSITSTTDGGYIVGGYSESGISGDKTENSRGSLDYWVLKLDWQGNIEWQKTLGGSSADQMISVLQTTDNGYLLAGNSSSNISGDKTENSRGFNDYWIVKLDNAGNIMWQKTIGGSGGDTLYKALQSNDGGYLLAGTSLSSISGDKTEASRGSYDFWVVKINNSGIILWQRTIGGSDADDLLSAANCGINGYILAGGSRSPVSGEKTEAVVGNFDGWVVRIDESGNILWQKDIGGIGGEGFNSVIQTTDGGFFLSGVIDSPISGDVVQEPKGIQDYWIIKLSAESLAVNNFTDLNIQVYPNPTTESVHINFGTNYAYVMASIVNIIGQVVYEEKFRDMSKIDLYLKGESGIYFVNLTNEKNEKVILKLIKE